MQDITSEFKSVIMASALNESEAEKVLKELGEAITLNFMRRIDAEIPENNKKELYEHKPTNEKELAGFIKKYVPADKAHQLFIQSAEEVLDKFLNSI
ncbi:MAG: hypothetical protein M1334_04055 [Patescibacteria group bacterium]|nr:hypothetical protein [Patescibacteria group bacterium]